MKKNYEMVIVFDQVLSKSEVQTKFDGVEAFLKEKSDEISRVENWGILKLAYKIQKKSFAYYFLVNFCMDSIDMPELENFLKFYEGIVRYLLINTKDLPTKPSAFINNKKTR